MIDYVNRKPRKKTESFGESLITGVACAVAMVVAIIAQSIGVMAL